MIIEHVISLKFHTVCFYCMSSRAIPKLVCRPLTCPYLMQSLFKNQKEVWNLSPASFSSQFLKKNISPVIFCQVPKFHFLVVFTLWIPKKCPYSELYWSAFSRIRTEYGEIYRITRNNWTRITPDTNTFHAVLIFLIKPFFL